MIRPPRFYATLVWVAALALALASTAPHAQLTIEIIGGGGTTIPIAIVPFAGEANYPYPLTGIVGADLARSGLFKLIDPAGCHNQKPMEMDMTNGDREQLKTWIEGDRDMLVAFLRAFVRCRGPNPPGDTRSTADFITGDRPLLGPYNTYFSAIFANCGCERANAASQRSSSASSSKISAAIASCSD